MENLGSFAFDLRRNFLIIYFFGKFIYLRYIWLPKIFFIHLVATQGRFPLSSPAKQLGSSYHHHLIEMLMIECKIKQW